MTSKGVRNLDREPPREPPPIGPAQPRPHRRSTGLSTLSGPASVRVLAGARFASMTGTQAAQTALAYNIFHQTGSATWAGAVLVATAGVASLAGPVSGWLSDRVDRRRIMVVSELAAAAVWTAMLVTSTPAVAVMVALLGTAINAPFRAASNAAVTGYVPAPDLPRAYGTISAAFNAALVTGPLVGGAAVASFGAHPVFAMNALTFLISGAMLCLLPPASHTSGAARTGPLLAGYTIAWRAPAVRRLVAITALSFTAFGLALVADLPLAHMLGAGPVAYAAITTAWGAGAIGGSWIAGRAMKPAAAQLWLAVGSAGMVLSFVTLAGLPTLTTAVLLSVLGGIGNGCTAPAWSYLLQQAAPDAARGRVFAAAETAEQAAFVAGLLAAGPLLTLLGPRAIYLIPAALLLAAAALSWQHGNRTRERFPVGAR